MNAEHSLSAKKQSKLARYTRHLEALSDDELYLEITPMYGKLLRDDVGDFDAAKLTVAVEEWRRRGRNTREFGLDGESKSCCEVQ